MMRLLGLFFLGLCCITTQLAANEIRNALIKFDNDLFEVGRLIEKAELVDLSVRWLTASRHAENHLDEKTSGRWLAPWINFVSKLGKRNQDNEELEVAFKALQDNLRDKGVDFELVEGLVPKNVAVIEAPENGFNTLRMGLFLIFLDQVRWMGNKQAFLEHARGEGQGLSDHAKELWESFKKLAKRSDRTADFNALLDFLRDSDNTRLRLIYDDVDELWKTQPGGGA